MRRGTTPLITIETDLDFSNAQYAVLTIEDRAKNEVSIDNSRMEINGGNVTVRMTQEETLSLLKGGIKLQLRVLFLDGTALASPYMSGVMEDILMEEVIP